MGDFYFPRAVSKAAKKIAGEPAKSSQAATPAYSPSDMAKMAQESADRKLAAEAAKAKAKPKPAPKPRPGY